MRSIFLFPLILAAVLLASTSQAQIQDRNEPAITVNPKLPVSIEYEFPAWNKAKDKIDTGFLIVRDAKSKRVAKVVLQETEPDTGIFVGQYVLTFAYDQDEVSPEIFTPPQSMIEKADSLKKIEKMIESGALLRKPSLVRKSKRGEQKLQVFDSREQAMDALDKIRKNSGAIKPTVDSSVLETQRQAAFEAEKKRLENQALDREKQRQQMALDEQKRVEQLRTQKLSAEETAKRTAQAKKVAASAMAAFQAKNFAESEKLFKQASDLDPTNRTYFFQYGVALYQTEKYNDSLVAFKMADDASVNALEKKYYVGLNHMKLKEFKESIDQFDQIEKANDPALSANAGFYAGLIEFSRENYADAKKHFEYTLDHSSNNAELDSQAESYIEQIAAIQQFEEERKTKFLFNINLGEQYDSNVLFAPTGDPSGTKTDKAGWRTLLMASAAYRPVYSQRHELSFSLNYIDMYTLNDKFKGSADLQKADPAVIGLSVPYKFKLATYQLALTPGTETINMDTTGEASRKPILTSNFVKADNTFIVSENYFSNLNLEWRTDNSLPTGSDDSDATKMTVASVNTFFVDKKKTVAWIGDIAYQTNNAQGDDAKYTRLELGVGYLTPIGWESILMSRLAWASQVYPDGVLDRKDTNIGLTLAASKPFSAKFSASLIGTYNQNASNVDANKYDKYSLMTLASWNFGL